MNSVRTHRWQSIAFFACLGALVLAGLVQRGLAVNPPSLWLDDLWTASLARFGSGSFLLFGSAPVAPGFVLILRWIGIPCGWGDWPLQVLPLAASLAQVVLMGWFCYRMTGSRALGLVAAALLVAGPTLSIYSVRVKPFALDGLIVLVVLCLAVAAETRHRTGYFAAMAVVSLLGATVSIPSILFGAIVVNALAVRLLLDRDLVCLRKSVAAMAFLYDVGMLLWTAVVLVHHGSAVVRDYWSGFYLPVGSVRAAAAFLVDRGAGFFWGAFPARLTGLAVFVPLGVLWLIRERRTRAVGTAVLGCFAAVFVASALRVYPVGGGRTDIFAYPLNIGMAVLGIGWLIHRYRIIRVLTAVLAIGTFVFEVMTIRYAYPAAGDRIIVEKANAMWRPGDGLLVYPGANWGVGYYGRWPVRLVDRPDTVNGFYVHPQVDGCLVLPELGNEASFGPAQRELDLFLTAGRPRIICLASNREHMGYDPHKEIVARVLAAGYGIRSDEKAGSAHLLVFEKP